MDSPEDLVRLDRSHVKPAAHTLVRAFQGYPVLHYAFSDGLARDRIVPYFFEYVLRYGIRYGRAYAASRRLEGVAIWLPSDSYPLTFWKLLRSGALTSMLRFG